MKHILLIYLISLVLAYTIRENSQTNMKNNLSAINCPIQANQTTHEFDLTSCSMLQNSTSLSFNMTCTVINDRSGAMVNRVEYQSVYIQSSGYWNRTNQPFENISSYDNHVGQEIHSTTSISISKMHFPKQGQYLWLSTLCMYSCGPGPVPPYNVCTCATKYWSRIPFTVKRGQIKIGEQ